MKEVRSEISERTLYKSTVILATPADPNGEWPDVDRAVATRIDASWHIGLNGSLAHVVDFTGVQNGTNVFGRVSPADLYD